jgi:hypothetical protein
MTKVVLSITIEEDLVKALKNQKSNVSRYIEELIQENIITDVDVELAKKRRELEVCKNKILMLEAAKEKRDREEKERLELERKSIARQEKIQVKITHHQKVEDFKIKYFQMERLKRMAKGIMEDIKTSEANYNEAKSKLMKCENWLNANRKKIEDLKKKGKL